MAPTVIGCAFVAAQQPDFPNTSYILTVFLCHIHFFAGPLIWYQKFEYAIAHWLQKATEHVLGCVLCSPGCFSLFRAEALMQENVMAKYATTSTKANHYLQYDQGSIYYIVY